MRAALALAAAVEFLGSLAGCEKAKSRIPDDPQPRPAALIATIEMPTASALVPLRDLVAAINTSAAMAVDPTIVMMTATSGVGAASLEALDPDAPMYALWLDDGKVRGLTVVGKIKNEDAVAKLKPAESVDKNGWIAVASSKEILDMVAPYALTTVVAKPPTRPTGTIYVPNVVARYNDKIVALRNTVIRRLAHGSPLDAASSAGYVDGLVRAIRDTDEIRIALEPKPKQDGATLDLTVVPKPSTNLAGFIAAQKPSEFALASKLPDRLGSSVLAGRLVLGPYQASIIKWIANLYVDPFGAGLVDSYLAVLKAMSGEIAAAATVRQSIALYMIAALDDPPAVEAALGTVQAAFKTSPTMAFAAGQLTYRADPDITIDGVTLHVDETIIEPARKIDPKKTDPKKTDPRNTANPTDPKTAVPDLKTAPATPQWKPGITVRKAVVGVVDKLLVLCATENAVEDTTRGIQIARGKLAGLVSPPALTAEMSAARARKDSVILAFDASSLGGTGLATMTAGFADKTLHIQVSVPTSVVRSLQP